MSCLCVIFLLHKIYFSTSPNNSTSPPFLYTPLLYFATYIEQCIQFLTDVTNVSRELSLHPVHLTADREGNLPPSALVPFCSYQGESSLLGRQLPEMGNLTVCDKFRPTILEGQLCYTLDSALFKEVSTKSGKSNGLLLLIDDPNSNQMKEKSKAPLGSKLDDKNFKVFIHTLAQYTTFGPGSYMMTSLKKMTGTPSFNQLPDHQKECFLHNREECQTQKYLDQVQKACKCMPWALQINQVEMIYTPP